MLSRFRIHIRPAFAAAFIAASVIPLVGFWYWTQTDASERAIARAEEHNLLIARNISAALARYHADLITAIAAVAPEFAAGRTPHFATEQLAALQVMSLCAYEGATPTLAKDWMVRSADCPQGFAGDVLAMHEGAIRVRDDVWQSPVLFNRIGEPMICYIVEVGETSVIAMVSTDYVREVGQQITFGEKGHAAIVDHTGKVIFHPNPDWIAEARDISGISTVRKILDGEQGAEAFYSPALRGEVIAGFSPIQSAGWGIMVPQPSWEISAGAAIETRQGLTALALAALLAAFLSIVFVALFARPVTDALRIMRRMEAGEMDARFDMADHPRPIVEIEEFSRSFNAMAERLDAAKKPPGKGWRDDPRAGLPADG